MIWSHWVLAPQAQPPSPKADSVWKPEMSVDSPELNDYVPRPFTHHQDHEALLLPIMTPGSSYSLPRPSNIIRAELQGGTHSISPFFFLRFHSKRTPLLLNPILCFLNSCNLNHSLSAQVRTNIFSCYLDFCLLSE